ncbi:MAG: AAA domain-containing protein [Sphaerobacter sp.]|nr:AAA domain-containing protein [Sphaerobacter sp.]
MPAAQPSRVAPAPPAPPGPDGRRLIAPTDLAQFIRLDQCQRYLRLRLHERVAGSRFLRAYDVVPQSLPPLLTRSGRVFEARVEAAIRATGARVVSFATPDAPGDRDPDNDAVLALVRDLGRGETAVLLQPRLAATIGDWHLRGDADILRLTRGPDGRLAALVADIKSSTAARLEHRLQVACYGEMLATILAEAGIDCAPPALAVLYRGSPHAGRELRAEEAAELARQREAARTYFGLDDALLDIVADPESFRDAVHDLVTGPDSLARRVAEADFAEIPFHLTYRCDGCLYNEFCMKWSAEQDDLSLLPHLTPFDKSALRRAGITRVRELALLKDLPGEDGNGDLVPAPGQEARIRQLATTWPVGPRLDELIHRARRYRAWKGEPITARGTIPSKGYGSLPYRDAAHNPNLVCVYIDAQHDYLHDRIYLLGARVVAHEGGVPVRRKNIVHLTDGPPDSPEREERLFLDWIRDTVRAIVELAAPDESGGRRAPIHLIFYDRHEQRLLLDGLARHFETILGATPLYDFVTQLAAFDSPLVTFLDQEIRELKNYPMVCQSLHAVAAYLRFDWNTPSPYREIFRARIFDVWGKLDREDADPEARSRWYFRRARFGSHIPLEYAYAAWGELPDPPGDGRDDYAPYRGATRELLLGFQARRLEALEHIAADFPGNQQTTKTPFHLPDLATFQEKALTLGQAMEEFVIIERHVELAAWKAARLAPPERRALAGETLVVRYAAADQPPEVRAALRAAERRRRLREEYERAYLAQHPEATQVRLTREQRAACAWEELVDDLTVRLRLETDAIEGDLDEVLALSTLKPDDQVLVCPRWTVDSRLPEAERQPFTPTPKQMLYQQRGRIRRITVERDAAGRAVGGFVEVQLVGSRGGTWSRGFVFPSFLAQPLEDGAVYTLDPDPNNWLGYYALTVAQGLAAGQPNALHARLLDLAGATVAWPAEAAAGQQRFLAGLDALHAAGALHGFEESKRAYIGDHGADPVLLVQGPPGTGKSYTTGFAILARLQGALAADRDFRVLVCCKTHAATRVAMQKMVEAQRILRLLAGRHPDIFRRHFDPRLLDVPLFTVGLRGEIDGTTPLDDRSKASWERIAGERWCVAATVPAGVYKLVKARWERHGLFGHELVACLVLDEASQMSLPEAAMAALPLAADGQLIVVGDHRQMPPIVHHAWDTEPRRTFQEFRTYQSLFLALRQLAPPMIKFSESFRLHAAMAEFLRREVYQQDGIPYFSRRRDVLERRPHPDPFVASVLAPEHPIVVVVHDEAGSQVRNPFEQALITPILQALTDPAGYALGPEHGVGVVVPHRAQRAALQEALPALTLIDPATGAVARSAIDTVERFQGDERIAIVVSATESDRDYLLTAGEFLLDPRRLTVALSRARQKVILVASRAVFDLFSADETIFANALLWKHLLRRTCTQLLWAGERHGHRVEVWGNGRGETALTP